MKTVLTLASATVIALSSIAYAVDESSKEIPNTSIVESGTYNVTAHRVDPEEKEIYVKTNDGKILELYFKDDTKLTKGDQEVKFDELKNGQKLEVTVEKTGDHLKPLAVEILE